MLTSKQHQLLLYIDEQVRLRGVPPSFDEMKEALGLRSKSGIHRLITALEERGFIRRLPHRARALEILRMPESIIAARTQPRDGAPQREAAGTVIRGAFSNVLPAARHDLDETTVTLPLHGRIAAGTPIEALSDNARHIVVSAAMLGSGEHYALEVAGDSMVDAGIRDGDTIIIKRCDIAENGAIVVALIDEEVATLKRFRRRGNSVALEAANPKFETRIFGPDRVRIQGRLAALIRNY